MPEIDLPLLAILLLFVAYFVATSALIVWAALSRARIAIRCGVLLGWLVLWIPAQVDDLGWLALVEAIVVIGVCGLIRSFQRREEAGPRLRFGLKDLLIAMVLVGLVLWIGLQWPHRYSPASILALGVMAGSSSLAAAWLVFGARRLWLRVITFVLIQAAAFACLRWGTFLHEEFFTSQFNLFTDGAETFIASVLACGHGLWLLMVLLAASATAHALSAKRKVALATIPLTLIAVPAIFLVSWLFTFLVAPLYPPEEPSLENNAYPRLVEMLLAWKDVIVPQTPVDSDDARRQFATEHADEIAEIRRLARAPSWAIVDYDDAKYGDLLVLRAQPRNFATALENAALDQPASARADIAIDLLHLADRLANGGLLIDHLVAHSYAERGAILLHRAISELTAQDRERLVLALSSLETSREPIDQAANRDLVWSLSVGWEARAQLASERLIGMDSAAPTVQALVQSRQRGVAWLRILQLELALAHFKHQHRHYPDSLEELVPALLSALPLDPFSDRPFHYRREGDGYLLYGVGANGIDEGGTLAIGSVMDGDQRFDDAPPQ